MDEGQEVPVSVQTSAPTEAPQPIWPKEAQPFVDKAPEGGDTWRCMGTDGEEIPTSGSDSGSTFYEVRQGDLPRLARLTRASVILPHQAGYVEGATEQKMRKTSEWEAGKDWILNDKNGLAKRKDFFYDDQGRIVAFRTANFPVDTVPFGTPPTADRVESIRLYRYTTDEHGKVNRQTASVSHPKYALSATPFGWSERMPYDSKQEDGVYLPPKK